MRVTGYEIRNLGLGIWATGYEIRNLGLGIWVTRYLAAGLKPRARLGSSGWDFARSASNYRTGIREKDEGFLTRLRH